MIGDVDAIKSPGHSTGGESLMQETTLSSWDKLEQLGEGGQSEVFRVRRPERVQQRLKLIDAIMQSGAWAQMATPQGLKALRESGYAPPDGDISAVRGLSNLLHAAYEYARPEYHSELAALKIFKMPKGEDADEALARLANEISVLRAEKPGLVKLIDANEEEGWMATEFMRRGTLEKHPYRFKGDAALALKAFRSLVATVASLHIENIVHRDIKPANVFLTEND